MDIREYIRKLHDETGMQQIKRLFDEVWAVFPEYTSQLSAVYLYDQWQQRNGLDESDAVFWVDVTTDIGVLYAVGISLQALENGENYAILCLLHELAHLEHEGHRISFHRHLDAMICRFNAATGKNLVNDYESLQMRHDSRPYVIDWGSIPKKAPRTDKKIRYG